MKGDIIPRASIWMLCAAVIICLGYSILVLSAKPAYATPVCEPEDCAIVQNHYGQQLCQTMYHENMQSVDCPLDSNDPDVYRVYCADGNFIDANCSTF